MFLVVVMGKFPVYRQLDEMDCGPTCLRMIAKYHGKHFSLEHLRKLSYISKSGVSLLGLSEAAEKIGFKAMLAEVTFDQLDEEIGLPCIIHWKESHYVVVTPQDYSGGRHAKIEIADPAFGLAKISKETFLKCWLKPGKQKGLVVMLDPTYTFHQQPDEKDTGKGIGFLLHYLKPHRKFLLQLVLGMFLGSVLSLIFPFLTQSLVDNGVNHKNIGFIQFILFSQVALVVGTSALDMIRNWILINMSSRINISIISDFLIKLMKLPVRFFDTKMAEDIMQRMADHSRVEYFLTNSVLSTLFSLINLFVFSIVLYLYSIKVATVFLVGSALSVLWITLFSKHRKNLDYQYFQEKTMGQNSVYELIMAMKDIKLNNSELEKRWNWERIQVRLFNLRIRGLSLEQYQKMGNIFFLQIKNIVISYMAAVEVVNGSMTLGMMLSVSYIIGQMNSPVEQLLGFIRAAQDAKISLERLNEIHSKTDEERPVPVVAGKMVHETANVGGGITFRNVSFQYGDPSTPLVLQNNSFYIPPGKVTAVVGMSGSGKTTLLKLLLKFYDPTGGVIQLGNEDLQLISANKWRSKCGVVMQDGFLFSDTIAGNIALGVQEIDTERLYAAARIANIDGFIREMPQGYNTRVGSSGDGISAGQRLRILIARAVYRNPQYLFFDEATSVLDATNERIIMENLSQYFEDRTVILIAHRLSTVRHADQILMMDKGRVVEMGTHDELLDEKGKYFELVRNQLE